MRSVWLSLLLAAIVCVPSVASAQADLFKTPQTPPPTVSAGGAEWQINGEPIMVGGLTYYPTRASRPFDPQVMVQTGTYENTPVYTDATLEPYTEVYVPVGGGRTMVYDRKIPAVPSIVERETPAEREAARPEPEAPVVVPAPVPRPVRVPPTRTSILTGVPRTKRPGPGGVWLAYAGARWYSDGPAVPYAAERFEAIGEYQGFPVYHDKVKGGADIWVAAVKDGLIAPYAKR